MVINTFPFLTQKQEERLKVETSEARIRTLETQVDTQGHIPPTVSSVGLLVVLDFFNVGFTAEREL